MKIFHFKSVNMNTILKMFKKCNLQHGQWYGQDTWSVKEGKRGVQENQRSSCQKLFLTGPSTSRAVLGLLNTHFTLLIRIFLIFYWLHCNLILNSILKCQMLWTQPVETTWQTNTCIRSNIEQMNITEHNTTPYQR